MATINEMRQVATQIENETTVGGNTAERVGGLFNDIVDKLEVQDEDIAEVQEAADDVRTGNTSLGDLSIEDEQGNALAVFANGGFRTKNFDSETDTPTQGGNAEAGDFEIADPDGNVLLRLQGGHVMTKNFDSSQIVIEEKIDIDLVGVFKKVYCLGDSFTAGYTSIGGVNIGSADARPLKNNWCGYIEKMTGNDYENLAIGSSTTHHWRYSDGPSSTYHPDINLANDTNADAYIIGLGVNDERTGMTVGTSSSIASNYDNNADNFTGNYDWIVRKLMSWNTRAHIFCMTIPLSEGNVVAYNDMIDYICSLYPSKVHKISLEGTDVDLSWIAGSFSNGHYCPIVYNYFASIIYRRISAFVWDNYTRFQTVPYA